MNSISSLKILIVGLTSVLALTSFNKDEFLKVTEKHFLKSGFLSDNKVKENNLKI